jgi:hypothetical protein
LQRRSLRGLGCFPVVETAISPVAGCLERELFGAMNLSEQGFLSTEARIPADRKLLAGRLSVTAEARGMVVV